MSATAIAFPMPTTPTVDHTAVAALLRRLARIQVVLTEPYSMEEWESDDLRAVMDPIIAEERTIRATLPDAWYDHPALYAVFTDEHADLGALEDPELLHTLARLP